MSCPTARRGLLAKWKKAKSGRTKNRRWRAKCDFAEEELAAHRETIRGKASGQKVETFVADEWTLEYDLAYAGLAEDVWLSAMLARQDDKINDGSVDKDAVVADAQQQYAALQPSELEPEELASRVYALFTTGTKASKAVTAQYLAERLESKAARGELTNDNLAENLPAYLKAAIAHVTVSPPQQLVAMPHGH